MPGVLKRKRSESEFSSSSQLSSPPRPSDSTFFFSTTPSMDVVSPTPCRFSPTPSHLHSRTMKRFRDNRPSEEEVHRYTLSLLYSAQRDEQHHHQQQPQHHQTLRTVQHPSAQLVATTHQPSLHSFWKLPRPVSAFSSSMPSPPVAERAGSPTPSPSCEDCGVGLTGDEPMDVDDCNGYGFGRESCSCSACGKAVCFSCSVSNLGEERRCLMCAGR